MAIVKDVFSLTDDPGDLVCLLADLAALHRAGRTESCLYGHDAGRFFAWGPCRWCGACGTPVRPVLAWHHVLVAALRYCVAVHGWNHERHAA